MRASERFRLFCGLVALALLGGLAFTGSRQGGGGAQPRLLSMEDFEKVKPGSLPSGVFDNSSWAGVEVPLQVVDADDLRQGKLLKCLVYGFAQLVLGQFPLQQGAFYRVAVDIASQQEQEIQLAIQGARRPYTEFASRFETVSKTMRTCSFLAQAGDTVDQALLLLKMHGVNTLSIDNISIEQVAGETPPDDPPVAGNLLLNAGFELGSDGWFVRGRAGFPQTRAAFEGQRVLKLLDGDLVSSTWLRLSRQCDYTVRARLRSLRSKAQVQLAMGSYVHPRGSAGEISRNFTLHPSDGWQTVGFRWRPPLPTREIKRFAEHYLSLKCQSSPGSVVLVDAVEVKAEMRAGQPDVFQPHAPLELAITTDMPCNVATVGEPVAVTVVASSAVDAAILTILDEQERRWRTLPLRFSNRQARLELTDLPPGYWHLLTAPKVGDDRRGQRVEGESFLAVVPPMPDVPLTSWFSGTHIPDVPAVRQACWKLGLRWNRLHDNSTLTKWDVVQPQAQVWRFDDRRLARHRAEGQLIMGLIDRLPPWIQADSSPSQGPERGPWLTDRWLPVWQQYARRCADHWRGAIERWEVVNEPNDLMSPAHYLKVLQSAQRGLKAGNPGAVVVAPASALTLPWFREAVSLGVGRFCDVISFHGYGLSTWSTLAGPERLTAAVKQVRTALEAAGTPGLPIWDTECGVSIRPDFTKFLVLGGEAGPMAAARMFATSLACARAAGLSRIFYYSALPPSHAGDNGGLLWLLQVNGVARRCAVSVAVAVSLLEGRRYLGQRDDARSQGVVELVFQGRGATLHMLWRPVGSISWPLPPTTSRVISMWGRSLPVDDGQIRLTQDPVYIVMETG